jgi:hypothetical protein
LRRPIEKAELSLVFSVLAEMLKRVLANKWNHYFYSWCADTNIWSVRSCHRHAGFILVAHNTQKRQSLNTGLWRVFGYPQGEYCAATPGTRADLTPYLKYY